jgi:hypothetical protein
MRKRVPKGRRRAFDSLAVATIWAIWIQRNDWTFRRTSLTASGLVDYIFDSPKVAACCYVSSLVFVSGRGLCLCTNKFYSLLMQHVRVHNLEKKCLHLCLLDVVGGEVDCRAVCTMFRSVQVPSILIKR